MSDIDVQDAPGQPVVETPDPEPTPAPEPTPEPAPAPEPAPQTPTKYAGKSAEDLQRMLEEQERYVGRLGNELGEARAAADYFRQQALEAANAPKANPVVSNIPDNSHWDWERFQTKPVEAIDAVVEARIAARERQREEREAVREFGRGKATAMDKKPHLFKGIEGAVEAFVRNGVRAGVVDSASLGDPETWYTAAILLQAKANGFDLPRPAAPALSPTPTDRPNATRPNQYAPADETVEFSPKTEAMLKGLGISTKRAAEIWTGKPRSSK